MLARKPSEPVRVEKDSLGERPIRAEAYYGIHTARAVENFRLSGYRLHKELIVALAMVKKACALANLKAGILDAERAGAICRAADEIIAGKWHDQFVVEAIQGGAGTAINMNANEVIANRALELLGHSRGAYDVISPLDHVNRGQSTNDVLPTAARIAGIRLLEGCREAYQLLEEALRSKAVEYGDLVRLGRTHLQDAVPIRAGQELGAWAEAVRRDRERIGRMAELLAEVNLGGTAIGTGLNADPKYREIIIEELRAVSGIKQLRRAANLIDATQNLDTLVEVSGLLRAAAVTLNKLANDLRLLASGPTAGLAEVELPALAAGSSIMAGKVNPIIPETVNQACFKIFGNDQTILWAAGAGQLELNVMQPVLSFCLFESIEMLARAVRLFAAKAISGLKFRRERCEHYANHALSLVTALVPHIGYARAAELAKEALRSGKSIKEVARASNLLSEEVLEKLLSPREMS